MPGFIKRPDEAQHLRPWTEEDYERLQLPVYVKPEGGMQPKPARKRAAVPGRSGAYLEVVPDPEPEGEPRAKAPDGIGFRRTS
jgi:hypothetical protein